MNAWFLDSELSTCSVYHLYTYIAITYHNIHKYIHTYIIYVYYTYKVRTHTFSLE